MRTKLFGIAAAAGIVAGGVLAGFGMGREMAAPQPVSAAGSVKFCINKGTNSVRAEGGVVALYCWGNEREVYLQIAP